MEIEQTTSKSKSNIVTIISGGQTGADRGALRAARDQGTKYGGWCPLGGWAEDLTTPPGIRAEFPLLAETSSHNLLMRTMFNITDSDATLIVGSGKNPPGTGVTSSYAKTLGRPLLQTDGSNPEEVKAWLAGLGTNVTLNVAGPRESRQPGVEDITYNLIKSVLS